jgi:glycosyltransferase involved in cell wall biosynthesis
MTYKKSSSNKKKILVLAYAVSPTRGSEYSVAWNYIKEISKYYDVDVLYGASGLHLGDCNELESYLENNDVEDVNFIKVEPTRLQKKINVLNKAGLGYAFYIAFRLWHKSALKLAKELTKSNNYSIVHQLNPIGFREPGYLYRLNIPFIWGPIGGGNFINPKLVAELPLKRRLLFLLKNCINYLQLNFSSRVKESLGKADALIFCNSENLNSFNKYHGVTGEVLSEQAIADDILQKITLLPNFETTQKNRSGTLKLIWVGRLCPGKNISFLLNVLALLTDDVDVSLTIVGDGELKNELKQQVIQLGVQKYVRFLGALPREQILIELSKSDLHCLCSFSEANTTVIYEAFSVNTPTISLAQNGMLDTLKDGKGFLIPITNINETQQLFADKIMYLSKNRNCLNKARSTIFAQRHLLSWKFKGEVLNSIYQKVIEES